MKPASLSTVVLRLSVVLVCALMLAPIVIVVLTSFNGESYLSFPPKTFSPRWYIQFAADARWLAAIWKSLIIASMTCIFATAVGFLAAYAMARGAFSSRSTVVALLLTPLIVPHVVTAIALYFVSARFGLVGIRPWVALAHSAIALPVVLVVLQAALHNVDPNLERAAMICGCSRVEVMRRVILPLVAPSLISAILFSFLTSFDELVISLFLAGVRSQTLPVRIWNSLQMEIEPTIAAVSSLLIAVTCVALMAEWLLRRRRTALDARPAF